MSKFENLRIGTRLALSFGALLTLAAIVVAIGVLQMGRLDDAMDRITQDRLPKVLRLADLTDDVNLVARELRNTMIFDEPERVAASIELVMQSRKTISTTYEAIAPTIRSQAGRQLMADTVAARTIFNGLVDELIASVRAGHRAEAVGLLAEKVRPAQLAYMAALKKWSDVQVAAVKQEGVDASALYDTVRLEMLGVFAAMLVVGSALAWWVSRSITRPIGQAVEVARRVAAGDLGSQVAAGGRDETGELLQALGTMNGNLSRIVARVRASSDSIATGAAQIAAGSADLSQRTEEQASNLEQTAASMEQMNATVQQNAGIAQQATQLADAASQAASRGGEVVGQVVTTMQAISGSAARIADIIGVIDGIAFQTNILALNAAVEAARAGEQGRGFAVVAGEVRTLAHRSAEAAREIKSLIGQSTVTVESGSRLVGEAGATMSDIVSRVKRMADLIGEMGAATREQTQGIGQVSDAVAQLDQVTQQNAALVEESTAAAESLRQQASGLEQAVAEFRLGDGPAPAKPAAAEPVRPPRPASPARTPAARDATAPVEAAAPVRRWPPAAAVPAGVTAGDDWTSF